VSDAGPGGRAGSIDEALGYAFRDRDLVETALAHPSYAHEIDGSRGNERLEFLGDAVVNMVVAQLLYAAHPDWAEGELTRARAALVNKNALAATARELGLGGFVKLGRTEQRSAGEEKDSILANCLEALVAAVYLDGGLLPVVELARRLFGDAVERGTVALLRDAKTRLQEWAHAQHRCTPSYRTVQDSGTDNDERRFTVEVLLGDRILGSGLGRSKRAAERAAAEDALAAVPEPELAPPRDV
jgi:ribonuclease-3